MTSNISTKEIKELKVEGFCNFKKTDTEWKPLFRGRGYPTNPNLWASSKQRNKIFFGLEELGIDIYKTIFKIGGAEKKLFDLNKGDAWNIIEAIKKGQIKKFVK